MVNQKYKPGSRITVRLRSTDEKIADWLNRQENATEAVLKVLDQYLQGSSQVVVDSVLSLQGDLAALQKTVRDIKQTQNEMLEIMHHEQTKKQEEGNSSQKFIIEGLE